MVSRETSAALDVATIDRPFAPPIEAVLYLPAPPSVNKTRKVHWLGHQRLKKWQGRADMSIMANGGMRHIPRLPGRFEAIITLDENLSKLDLDNAAKALIDYARRLGVIIDDNKKYMRRVTIEWGHAPHGCRLTLRSVV